MRDDERWREHRQVAVDSVRLTDVRPYHEARAERRRRERLREAGGAREWRPCGRIRDELDPGQQPPATYVADPGQLPQCGQPVVEYETHGRTSLDERVLLQVVQRRHSGCTERGVMRE